jgi:hypothetical protein
MRPPGFGGERWTSQAFAAAFEAIAATLPFASAGFEHEPDAKGQRQIWLQRSVIDRLRALRGPGESYSDVILRRAKGDVLLDVGVARRKIRLRSPKGP